MEDTDLSTRDTSARPLDWTLALLVVLAGFKLLLHLSINLWGGYEIFRDELYYLACADHLAWGYVDQPPLSIVLLAGVRGLIGDSLFAIRLLPAIAGAMLVFVTGLLSRAMGGRRFAVGLAATASIVAGQVLAVSSVWSMNIFDLLLVALAMLWLVRLINTDNPWYWLAIGATLGLGLLSKVGVLWVGLGIAVAIVATPLRRWLATPWPWVAGVISALIFLPYVFWNASHDWAHLEFIERAVSGKYSGLSAWTFLSGQLRNQNPSTFLLWASGLVWLLVAPGGRRYRPLGIIWVTACLVLLANGQSKAGYLGNAFAMLFAAGGIAWERVLPNRAVVRTLAIAVVAAGAILAPLATPLLPVDTYVRYAAALGFAPSTDEGHELAQLPQFYADMFGWEQKAAAVAAIYHTLPAADRARAAIFSENYGRAGAIDYYADEYDLPGAIGNHNNYWIWGPGEATGEVVIFLGGDEEDLRQRFTSLEVAGVATCDDCIPYERNLPIFVGRGMQLPIEELWPLIGHYD